jgi:hypothetical protein
MAFIDASVSVCVVAERVSWQVAVNFLVPPFGGLHAAGVLQCCRVVSLLVALWPPGGNSGQYLGMGYAGSSSANSARSPR